MKKELPRQKLSRLIRARAYAQADLDKKKRSIDRRGWAGIKAKLNRIDAEIAELAPSVDVSDIRPVQKHDGRKIHPVRGLFTSELCRVLQEANGKPIGTTEIRQELERRLSLPNETGKQRAIISHLITGQLSRWTKRGIVSRTELPEPQGPGSASVRWVWIGL